MRIRIEGDGTYHGTRVVNAATGEPLEHVTAVAIAIDAKSRQARVTLEIVGAELAIDGLAELALLTTPRPAPIPSEED